MDINIWNHLKSDLSVIQSLWILNFSLPAHFLFFLFHHSSFPQSLGFINLPLLYVFSNQSNPLQYPTPLWTDNLPLKSSCSREGQAGLPTRFDSLAWCPARTFIIRFLSKRVVEMRYYRSIVYGVHFRVCARLWGLEVTGYCSEEGFILSCLCIREGKPERVWTGIRKDREVTPFRHRYVLVVSFPQV